MSKNKAMTNKQWRKFLRELPENPTLDDIGFVGWPTNHTPKEWKEITEEIGEYIRMHREKCTSAPQLPLHPLHPVF